MCKISLICSNCGDIKTMYKSERPRVGTLCKKCHIENEKKVAAIRRDALLSSEYLVCTKCNKEKAGSEFYLKGQNRKCKECMPYNQKVEHSCVKCGTVRQITKIAAKVNKRGLCPDCARKMTIISPEKKAKMSQLSREQVLRQGGVPNAKKFTKEHAGKNHYNWKGGITPEVMRIRNSEDTKIWRKAVYERDDYTCQDCGQRGGKLHAHHLKEFSKYPELRFSVGNGQTLCVKCHTQTHNYGRKKKLELV